MTSPGFIPNNPGRGTADNTAAQLPFPSGGAVTKAAVVATGLAAADIGALDSATANAAYAPKLAADHTAHTAAFTAVAGRVHDGIDISAGSFTITLPAASSRWQLVLKVKAASTTLGSTAATVTPAGTDTLNGGTTGIPLRYVNMTKTYTSDGAGAVTVTGGDFDKTVTDQLTAASIRNLAESAAPFMRLPKGWDTVWQAAKAAQATTPAWVLWEGTSITAGQSASDYYAQGFPRLVRDALVAAGTPLYAEHVPAYYCSTFTTASSSTPWSAVTGTNAQPEAGYGRLVNIVSTGTGGAQTLNVPAGVVKVELLYMDYIASSWKYSLDGAAAVTVTTTNSGGATTAGVKRVVITTDPATTHTVLINQAANGTSIMLCGANLFYRTTGIGHHYSGWPSMAIANLATAAGATTGPGKSLSMPDNKFALSAGTSIGKTNFDTFPHKPSLAVLEWGVNDNTYGTHPYAFRAALKRRVDALRRGVDNMSLLFLCPGYTGQATADDPSVYGRPDTWPKYKSIFQAVAAESNAAFVDVDSFWGQLGVTKGFRSGGIHPNTNGQSNIAALIAGVL